MAIGYTKTDWSSKVLPATMATGMDNEEDGIKQACDLLDEETDAGRALTQAATAAAQKTALGLNNVNNTSDADKPVSTAQAAAITAAAQSATNAAAAANSTDEVITAPSHWWVLVSGALKRMTHAGWLALVRAAVGWAAQTVGFTISGGTTSKTLTVSADADTADIPTTNEKTALDNVVIATNEPFTAPPTLLLYDADRRNIERASGGRATIFYSNDSYKVPCEAVWVDAFTIGDVAAIFSTARANSTAYSLGQMLMANSQLYEVTTAGTTGSAAPTYPTTIGDTVTDGTAVLTLRINSYNDLFPGFYKAGVAKSGWWFGRFRATIVNNRPLCIPGQYYSTMSIDNMRTYMANFGTHNCRPMTNWDWAILWLDAVRKGITPVGNTYYGRSHKTTEKQWGGIRADGARPGDTSVSSNPITRGGSAGSLWTHTREPWGVHDFIGNYLQWCDGAKIMDGQLYIAAHDNDPSLLSAAGEASWIATGIYFDSPVAGNDSGSDNLGTPIIASAVSNYTASVTPPRTISEIQADIRDLDYAVATWSAWSIGASLDSVSFLARRSAYLMGIISKLRYGGLSPLSASEGYGYIRNNGERFAGCGGTYYGGSGAGPAFRDWGYRRSSSYCARPVFDP